MGTLQRKREISTLTLKEAMLPFLAFGSRTVERSERLSQVPNNHWRMSSPAALLGHFISLTFDLINKILEVASWRQDYSKCKFFFVLPTLSHCLKNLSEERFPTLLESWSKEPSHRRTNILVLFPFQKLFNAHGALENVVAQWKIILEPQIDRWRKQ